MNITLETIRKSLVTNSQAIHVHTAWLYIYASILEHEVTVGSAGKETKVESAADYFATAGDGYKKVGKGYGIKAGITKWVIEQGTVDGVRYITESHCKMARMVIAKGKGSFARGQFVSEWFDIVKTKSTNEAGEVVEVDSIKWKKKGQAYKLIKAIESGSESFSETNGYLKTKSRASKAALAKVKQDRKSSVSLTVYDNQGNAVTIKKTKDLKKGIKANEGLITKEANNAMQWQKRAIERAIAEYNKIAKACDATELSLSA